MRDRWSDALEVVDGVSRNPARQGQHLDIRIVGPSLSITLLSLDDLRELITRARAWKEMAETTAGQRGQ